MSILWSAEKEMIICKETAKVMPKDKVLYGIRSTYCTVDDRGTKLMQITYCTWP